MKKALCWYFIITGLNYLIYVPDMFDEYSFPIAISVLILTIGYLIGGVVYLLGRIKAGYYILMFLLAISVLTIDTKFLSFKISSVLDLIFYFTSDGEFSFDLNLGGRYSFGLYLAEAIDRILLGIDIISLALLLTVGKVFKPSQNTNKSEEIYTN